MSVTVNVDLRELSGIGADAGVNFARLEISPYNRRHVEDGGDDYVLTENRVSVTLTGGVGVFVLPGPTPLGAALRIRERGFRGARERIVLIPDVVEVDYGDLVDVDPTTLDPTAPVSPAWQTYIDAIVATEAALRTAADALKANDADVVHDTGNETVAGVKTFSSAPVVPSSAFPESAVTGLVDDLAAKQPIATLEAFVDTKLVEASPTFGALFAPLSTKLLDPAVLAGGGVTHGTTPPAFVDYVYLPWNTYPAGISRYGELSEVTIGTPANGGGAYTAGDRSAQPYTAEFVYEGSHFAFTLDSYGSEYHLYVDDQPVTATPVSMGTAGGVYLHVPFAARGSYKIRLTIGTGAILKGLFYERYDSVYPAGRRLRLGVMGDSYSYPANNTTVGFQYWMTALTGFDVYPLGQGGTGYINTGTPANGQVPFGHANRVALVNAYDLDALMIVGSINDSDVGLQPIATAAFAAYAAARPNMPVIVAGPEPYDVFATPVATNNAVKAAALAAPNVIDFIDWYTDDWINGSGSTGAPAANGNADHIIGVDGVHPNLAGYKFLGRMFTEAIRHLPTAI